ncbi:MAG: N-acetylmuramoyl-L-alanine amidase, partial [Anaerolineaceae bacterium]|nr:N-acetylmuramoyl-L-alanine amidase [Anaerolineaceae bacterium]
MKSRSIKLLAMLIGVILLCSLLVQPTSATTQSLTGNKICIDPGHGGSDPGAVNADFNLFESHINLDVSYGLKWLLEQIGAEVVMTRTDDTYKDNNDRYTFCNNALATILISIHTNSVVDPTWDGSMALYFHPDDDDLVLAQTIYAEMYPLLKESAPDPDLFLPFGLDWFASGVLLKSDMPAT